MLNYQGQWGIIMNKIAILCSGGDVLGMNPAIKRFQETKDFYE